MPMQHGHQGPGNAEEGKGTGRRKKGMWEGDKDRGEDVGERIRWK